jgi:hypothetical protein
MNEELLIYYRDIAINAIIVYVFLLMAIFLTWFMYNILLEHISKGFV